MPEVRKYIWILPFIGSIITAIGLFTPAAVLPMGEVMELYWMHGFYLTIGGEYGPQPGFVYSIPMLAIIGIGCTILILICTIIMFISSLTHRTRETPGSWLALGILLIGGTIFFIVGAEISFRINRLIFHDVIVGFWESRFPSFAVIAPFITGGLTILGFIIGKSTTEVEIDITPISKDITPVSKEISQPVSTPIKESQGARFCPQCGLKITAGEGKFCPNCGYELKID